MSDVGVTKSSSFKSFELSAWQGCVETYDQSFTPLTTRVGVALVEQLGIGRNAYVLDCACGPGSLSAYIASLGAKVLGVDFSPNMVARAQELHSELDFCVQDAEALALPADTFDCVAMNFGMLHLGDPERATREATRVLKKGGTFGFTVWAPPTEALGFNVILEAIERYGSRDVKLPAGPPFLKYSDVDVARSMLRDAGLSDVKALRADLSWSLSSPREFFEAFLFGTARTGGLLRAQPKEGLEQIAQAAQEAAFERFQVGGAALEIPMPAMMYTATK